MARVYYVGKIKKALRGCGHSTPYLSGLSKVETLEWMDKHLSVEERQRVMEMVEQ